MEVTAKQVAVGVGIVGVTAAVGIGGYRLGRRFYDPNRVRELHDKVDSNLPDQIKFWEDLIATAKEAAEADKAKFRNREAKLRARKAWFPRRWLGWV
jgi:hypothetical protein